MNASMKLLTLDEFLECNLISRGDWERCDLDWDLLKAIGLDHQARSTQLEETAQFLAKTLQRFDQVHSVRWRVKKSGHLMAKIVRKRAEENEKYSDVTVENYAELITDLIGLRALHLFKSDCFAIDIDLRRELDVVEGPRAYVRVGDDQLLRQQYEQAGFEVQDHPHGYRSIHYVVTAQPTKRKVAAEIQVRTIFEEGWSEIDHTVRYPNFSDDAQVAYLLKIFNRIAGSADELGGFVKTLKTVLDNTQNMVNDAQDEARQAISERDASIAKMEDALDQLSKVQTGKIEQERISTVKHELAKFRTEDSTPLNHGIDVTKLMKGYKALSDPLVIMALAEKFKSFENIGKLLANADRIKTLEESTGVLAIAKNLKGITLPDSIIAAAQNLNRLDDLSGANALVKKLKGNPKAK